MRQLLCLSFTALFSLCSNAYEIAFSNSVHHVNGIPDGWKLIGAGSVKMWNTQPRTADGESGLGFNFSSASKDGENILCTTNAVIPHSDILCDNVFVRTRVYLQKPTVRVDSFQIVISTDDWDTYERIGDPIMIEESGRTTAEWVTLERRSSIPGLSASGKDVSVGILAKAGGSTGKTGYLGFLDLRFVAAATPQNVQFEVSGVATNALNPGEGDAIVSVDVNESPTDGYGKVEISKVKCILNRNGTITTNDMTHVGALSRWESEAIAPQIEAGESLKVSILSEYRSAIDTLGQKDADGVAREQSGWVEARGTKKGSVWINEFSANKVELCGTTNRVMLAGWKIELATNSTSSATYYADLGKVLCFTNNMINGVVGLETRELNWCDDDSNQITQIPDGAYYVRLRNAAGVVEHGDIGHLISVQFPLAGSVGMFGYAAWSSEGYGYDWTGTADGAVFTWGALSETSFGKVNVGQGFKVPVTVLLKVNTGTPWDADGTNLSYVTVIAKAYGLNNDKTVTTTKDFSEQSQGGVASITIEGVSATPEMISIDLSASAFGWFCKPKNIVVLGAVETTAELRLTPTIAIDDFEGELKDFWRNDGTLTWKIVTENKKSVLRLDARSTSKGTAILKCSNFLSSRGRKWASISFDFMNWRSTSAKKNRFTVELTTNSTWTSKADIVGTPTLISSQASPYVDREWYHYQMVFELPEGFAESEEIWLRLFCDSDGSTSSCVTVDNLRVAFQDVALPTNMTRSVVTPENGQNVEFALDILPQATGEVACVSADLHVEKNGVAEIVPLAFADGGLTNDLPAAAGAAQAKTTLGPFLVGDTVTYYAAVRYDAANGSTNQTEVFEKRYFPDNATIDDKGRWIVEGKYDVAKDLSANTFTVTGDPLTLVGKPETTSDGVRFTVHGYSANKLSEVSIYVNGEKCPEAQQPFAYLGTNNQIRVTGEFVIKTGLNASTTYTVTIKGKDGTGAELQEATFTFLTKPKEPVIMGVPKKGAYSPTKAFDFYALAEADDVANLNFHWLLDETATKSGNGETNYTDNVEADGPHTVRVYVTDQESNVSPTNSLSWVVDTIKPTKPNITGTPANGSVTNGVAYELTAKSTDANLDAFYWILDGAVGVRALPEEAFKGNVADGFGAHEVKCYAVDKAGNVSETNDWTWTVDTLAPTNLVISGYPANGSVTNGTSFRLTATAMDDTELTYWWSLDGAAGVRALPGEAFEGKDLADGGHAVSVYATDEAGNVSVTNSWKWTVDTEAPTKPDISGTPTNGSVTNEPNFHLSAKATDKTTVTYHWLTNGVAAVSVTNFEGKVTEEGEFVVSCYATDEANNVSETNSVSWTYDRTPPTVPVMSGAPVDAAVTNGTEYGYTATSFDVHFDAFYWSLDGATGVRTLPGVKFAGNVAEGYAKHTVRVFATDTAGNRSVETNWTWTVDTKKPTDLKLTGLPISDERIIVTNGFDFAFTASANDDMELTYHWKTNGIEVVDCTSSNFVGKVSEGTNAVSVYAKDVAGNVCDPIERMWVVDTHAPTKPVIDGTPVDGAITNVKEYGFTAESEDATEIAYHWTLKRGGDTASTGDEQTFSGSFAKDGAYTVFVYATDEAGNVSETNSWKWIVDTTAPENLVISGTPANGSVTNEPNFNLTAAATDATLITYHWLTNGVVAADVTNLVGRVEEEGLFEVKCYATDAAGNISKTNDWSWTFDRTPPTKPVITDNLKKGAITNVEAYDLTAASTDDHLITYHWTLGEKKETVTNFVGSVASSGEYTDFTAFVYATDEAGNVSETSSISWRLDTKRPSVTLTSTASGHFNKKAAPMEVTATFSEEVTNFTYECVTVDTGWASNEIVTVEAKKVFKFWVYPQDYGVPKFIDEETVSVSIDENKVWDYAGNGNEASRNEQGEQAPLTRVYDTKSPIVTLASETPDNFNASFVPLKVTIGVTGKGVTELAQESIVITNGVVAKFEKTDEKRGDDDVITEKTYALEVTPTKEALITVVVPESVLTNMTGNTNPASEPPVLKTYDNTAPTNLVINGEPPQNKVTAATTFDFEATADDLTAMKFHWTLNGVAVTDNETSKYSGEVEKGTNWVTVSATDAAGNTCAEVKRTWVVDFEPPENLTLSGTPGEMGKTNVTSETSFSYTAGATDDTKITYHWLTNGVEVVDNLSTELAGTAIEGTNTVSVYATDEADNVSVTNTILWVVDTIAPTVPAISGEPADKTITNAKGYSYTAESEDATKVEFWWSLDGADGVRALPGVPFAGDGLADGVHKVAVYAKDEAGNKSAATNWTWTVDTTKPTNLKVWGLPISDEKIVVTNGNDFAFEASATDATALKFHWATNGVAVTDITSSNFVGQVSEGTNTVTVYAKDAAGNVCDPIARTWVVDTIAPTVPVIEGEPADGAITNAKGYSYTAESEDATKVEFWWSLDGADGVRALPGVPFAGDGLADGVHKVAVYAKDEAGNKSVATNWTWTVDTTKPTNLKVWGLPISDEKIVVTNGFDFAFEASATDATALKFHWATNGVAVTDITSSNFVGKVGEGTNTVSVYAEDAAGNVCDPVTRTWVVDTIDPTVPVIEGEPADGAITNAKGYSYTAESEDATKVEFWWSLDGADGVRALPGVPFAGDGLTDGGHKVTVYAKDEAGNKSGSTNWTWTVDTTKPTNLKVWGLPISDEKIVVTNGFDFAFEASATDATALKFHWATNGVAVTDITSSNFVGRVGEGTNTVSVYAEDAAGNSCEPVTRTWVVDTIDPTVPVIAGEPADGAITQQTGFSYTAKSEDSTKVEFWWSLDGADGVRALPGVPFTGDGLADGAHSVGVYAKDEAGNKSAATNWTWTVDTTKPTNLKVWGLPISEDPEVIVLTNGCDFAFEASATDATALRFHWATNGVAVTDITASNFVGRVGEGTNTVSVYAEDAAGNACDPIERKWVVDITPPTVELSTELPADKVINIADVTPNGFKVLVDFSEPVVGFTAASVTITNGNGTVTAVETNSAASYAVWVMPDHDGLVPLKVEADSVKDLAGNGNVASDVLERTCDIKRPKVLSLKSNKANHFKWAQLQPNDYFEVTVTFDEEVTSFTASSVRLEKCAVKKVIPESGYSKSYTLFLEPSEGTNTIQVLEGGVKDRAGNDNVVSECLKLVYDNNAPTEPGLDGAPANGSRTQERTFCVMATNATDLLQISYHWELDGVLQEWTTNSVLTGSVGLGEHTVKLVRVSDELSNQRTVDLTWHWTVEDDTPSGNIDFGGGVYLEVNPTTHETNGVSFTAVDFHPGEDSTVTMSGFGVDPSPQSDIAPNISGLRMNLIVCDTLEGTRWKVKVDSAAYYDLTAKELTVTIPGEGTTGEAPVEPYKSFFVFGVENIEEKGK